MSHQPVTAGVTTGSSLAVALKLLEWADKGSLYPPPELVGAPHRLDPWSFLLGVLCGLCIFAVIEWLVTLRWCLVHWVQSFPKTEAPSLGGSKVLYKVC